jgi:hypothetical protein
VIGAPVVSADRLSFLASVWNVHRELLILSKQRMASRSSRLAPTSSCWLSIHFFEGCIFTCVIIGLVHFRLLKKLAWNRASLNNLVDTCFILFAIVTCFLRHPILTSKLIEMNYN